MASNHLILLPPISPRIRVFSNDSTLHVWWPKYWSFSFTIIPSKEHPGLISFRIDSLDLLAVQGTLKGLFQHHSSKASILWHSAFFMASSPITSWQIDGERVEAVTAFILGGSKITEDGDCSHEIKRRLLLGRKAMTNLDSILKNRVITLPKKVRLV